MVNNYIKHVVEIMEQGNNGLTGASGNAYGSVTLPVNYAMWDAFISNIESRVKDSNVDKAFLTNAVNDAKRWKNKYEAFKNAWNDTATLANLVGATVTSATTLQSVQSSAKSELEKLATTAETSLNLLSSECDEADGTVKESKVWGGLGATIGGVLTAAAGGFLVNKATRDIQAENLSAAERAAIEEWMDDIGRHIKCYIGPDEAGQYGDILSVTMD